jgi:hypothetical protein
MNPYYTQTKLYILNHPTVQNRDASLWRGNEMWNSWEYFTFNILIW